MAIAPVSGPLAAKEADKEAPEGAVQSTNSGGVLRNRGRQSRAGAMAEAVVNVMTGSLLALLAQLVALPVLGIQLGLIPQATIAFVLTVVSSILVYLLRRDFERLPPRGHR